MNERTWRFFEWDEDRWVLEHGDGMSVTVLYSNESNRAFLLRVLNAHDALVAAIKHFPGATSWGRDTDDTAEMLACNGHGCSKNDDHTDPVCHIYQVRAALRLAKGEAS